MINGTIFQTYIVVSKEVGIFQSNKTITVHKFENTLLYFYVRMFIHTKISYDVANSRGTNYQCEMHLYVYEDQHFD